MVVPQFEFLRAASVFSASRRLSMVSHSLTAETQSTLSQRRELELGHDRKDEE
jgi:hypothetical protein